jgi:transcription elongation factor GreB
MSKAFVKEDADDTDELPDEPVAALPAGTKNYITPDGFRRLQEELKRLQHDERPRIVDIVSWAAGNGDRSENGDYIYGKQRLREIDRRLRFLAKRLEIAEMVDPARQKTLDRVFFGATVTYANRAGE